MHVKLTCKSQPMYTVPISMSSPLCSLNLIPTTTCVYASQLVCMGLVTCDKCMSWSTCLQVNELQARSALLVSNSHSWNRHQTFPVVQADVECWSCQRTTCSRRFSSGNPDRYAWSIGQHSASLATKLHTRNRPGSELEVSRMLLLQFHGFLASFQRRCLT